ncbi:hypothetical protein EJ08DRAFT_465579 [Tothia fuscella]|uniref:Uncharacterized protein n=1 Tax=Tothia fuscella TaxID=1048955 RepID=A0A9P4NZ39_9PEZI|nr:hypothetical protein EJ08DRAFT_465579 [Tothia fuscella]
MDRELWAQERPPISTQLDTCSGITSTDIVRSAMNPPSHLNKPEPKLVTSEKENLTPKKQLATVENDSGDVESDTPMSDANPGPGRYAHLQQKFIDTTDERHRGNIRADTKTMLAIKENEPSKCLDKFIETYGIKPGTAMIIMNLASEEVKDLLDVRGHARQLPKWVGTGRGRDIVDEIDRLVECLLGKIRKHGLVGIYEEEDAAFEEEVSRVVLGFYEENEKL